MSATSYINALELGNKPYHPGSHMRPGVQVERTARVTPHRFHTPSPCCGADSYVQRRVFVEQKEAGKLTEGTTMVAGVFKKCGGCEWPYRLRPVGDIAQPSAIVWEVLADDARM